MFIYINTDAENSSRILEFFGMKAANSPTVILMKLDGDMTKYVLKAKEITREKIDGFVQSFIDGSLKPFSMSADIPEDLDKNPVKVLVGTEGEEELSPQEGEIDEEPFNDNL